MSRPSWQDFATHDESIVPELWDGVVGAWAPCLGPTGSRLHDMSKRANWGTLTNMDPATDWVIDGGQYTLNFDQVNNWIDISNGMPISNGVITVAAWVWARGSSFVESAAILTDTFNGSRVQFTIGGGNNPLSAGSQKVWAGYFDGNWRGVVASANFVFESWQHVLGLHNGTS